jgi:hypothetical protein
MFEQAVLPVQNEQVFSKVAGAIDAAFSPARVEGFIRSVKRAGLRIRQYEAVLAHGLLGKETPTLYASLGDSDRGQVREHYLRSLEQVAPELRQKYLKVYAYY